MIPWCVRPALARSLYIGNDELSGFRSEVWLWNFKRTYVTERQSLTETIQITEKAEESRRDRLKLDRQNQG